MATVDEWSSDKLAALSALVDESLPREKLSPDELLSCCWEDPGAVLGRPDGAAAVSVVVRDGEHGRVGHVRLVVVQPGARRQGFGRALLASAEGWLRDHGASTVQLGAARPLYLWPGIDMHSMVGMLCLAEASGYDVSGTNLTMSLPVTFRAEPPPGIVVRRVLDDDDAHAVAELVRFEWPAQLDLAHRGIEQGSCLAAFDEGPAGSRAVAYACHSVNRGGWLDPIGVAAPCRRRGIGSALVGQVCTDLMVASYRDVEVAGSSPIEFFARAGAAMSRVFRTYRKALG